YNQKHLNVHKKTVHEQTNEKHKTAFEKNEPLFNNNANNYVRNANYINVITIKHVKTFYL
ncbi:hypothetical protein AAHH78_40910, partial [Burkholderia pseudomallei]